MSASLPARRPGTTTYRFHVVRTPDRHDPAFATLVARVREAARTAAVADLCFPDFSRGSFTEGTHWGCRYFATSPGSARAAAARCCTRRKTATARQRIQAG